MSRSTHAGAVVFKLTRAGPRYLLVEARGSRGRWVFPKGHVEDGETIVAAAQREVAEEAGVRARPLRRLRRVSQKQRGEPISIAYVLMAYAGRTAPLEERRIRWLPLDEALDALDLAKNRRLLRSADGMLPLGANGQRRATRRVRIADWLAGIALFLRGSRGRSGKRRS
jgi:bis(5'-nucleosidyl)-tetraphosphatase